MMPQCVKGRHTRFPWPMQRRHCHLKPDKFIVQDPPGLVLCGGDAALADKGVHARNARPGRIVAQIRRITNADLQNIPPLPSP
jgi:hypothetical protein